jgi:hypothetical protein
MPTSSQQILTGADASALNAGILAAAPGVKGFFYTGGTLAAARRNLISALTGGSGDAAANGTSLTIQSTHITTPSGSRGSLRTQMREAAGGSFTVLAVARTAIAFNVTTSFAGITGNLSSTAAGGNGWALNFQASNGLANAKLRAQTQHVNGGSTLTQTTDLVIGALASAFQVYAMRVTAGVDVLIRNCSAGTQTVLANVNANVQGAVGIDIGGPPLAIGSNYGPVDIAAEVIAPDAALTDSQIEALYQQLKRRMSALGISV